MRLHNFTVVIFALAIVSPVRAQQLPGTELLEKEPDWAKTMVQGIDRWLDRETEATLTQRGKETKLDLSSAEAYEKSWEPKRDRLRKILGLIDNRVAKVEMEHVATTARPALVAQTDHFKAYSVRWTVLPGVFGEGLLLEPTGQVRANVVAIPDANLSPEQISGLAPGVPTDQQFARRLAENGCRVVVPVVIDRQDTWSGNPAIGRMTNQSHREFVHRMAYEMGRTIIGYELQRIFAAIDWFASRKDDLPIGVYGHGEGGLLALHAAALDTRIGSVTPSGYFGSRQNLHDEPYDRDVWNLLREFGDGELLQMILPRFVAIEQTKGQATKPPEARKGRTGGAPGKVAFPLAPESSNESERGMMEFPGRKLYPKSAPYGSLVIGIPLLDQLLVPREAEKGRPGLGGCVHYFLQGLGIKAKDIEPPAIKSATIDTDARMKRQFEELVTFTQALMPEAARNRQKNVWNKLNLKSIDEFKKSQEPLRDSFWNDLVGKLPEPNKNPRPRTRLVMETPKWKGYEVVLDVYDDVISYGILLVPNDLKPGEKRPCVVCQHGLEGRPMDVVNPKVKTPYYNSFGARLADKGYIVFAPQAPYIFGNQFRQTVRKMHPLGLNLYAFIVRQHQVILNFLGDLPFVDTSRIAYYGLSYGGKVAMRIPSILLGYCAVICSGDFNEWVWKNITLDWMSSYMFTGEYDMYEFNLGNTFSYAEMSALIAPRPFMVERGHDDGVGLDEYVAFEFAKTRRLYSRLGIADRTEIEFFPGGHEIRGAGTYAFLRKHLKWDRE